MIWYKDLTLKVRWLLKYIDENFDNIEELTDYYINLDEFYSHFSLELDFIILDYKKQVDE